MHAVLNVAARLPVLRSGRAASSANHLSSAEVKEQKFRTKSFEAFN